MLLRILGLIPIVAGLATVVFGAAIIPDSGSPSASTESELRFYGTWWVGAGLFLWWVAGDLEHRRRELRVLAGLLALGATARLIGLVVDGEPHAQFLVLMGIEYVVALWLLRIAAPRTSRTTGYDR